MSMAEAFSYQFPPFSIMCQDCDAGQGIVNKEDAHEAGWTEIERDLDGASWNDMGLCPDCANQRKEDENAPHSDI